MPDPPAATQDREWKVGDRCTANDLTGTVVALSFLGSVALVRFDDGVHAEWLTRRLRYAA